MFPPAISTGKYGRLSPIAFKTDAMVGDDPSDPNTVTACTEYHYPMYHAAVEYLLDKDGLGRSPEDVTNLFIDLVNYKSFPIAFENNMGIGLAEYEE